MTEARITVRVTPRSARDQVVGWDGDMLRVRVTAPPAEGRANAAVERLVARALDLPQRAVRLVAGARGRDKVIAIEGIDEAEARRRLAAASAPARR